MLTHDIRGLGIPESWSIERVGVTGTEVTYARLGMTDVRGRCYAVPSLIYQGPSRDFSEEPYRTDPLDVYIVSPVARLLSEMCIQRRGQTPEIWKNVRT